MQSGDKTTGIILAGGKSSRMGMDKGFCAINGKPMVQYAIEVLEQVCDSLIISSNNPDYELFGFPVIPDLIKDIGPMGGIYTGLMQSETKYNFFLSCDMPMVSVGVIRHILEYKQNYDAVVPIWKNYPEPMCAYYHKRIIDKIDKLIQQGIYKTQVIISEVNAMTIEITENLPFYNDQLFANVNCQTDLEELQQNDY
jgi:molybdopterin-guanine dinucleotide biosynthesis protein A